MSETVLINAASVLASANSAVEAYQLAVPNPDFRVACDQTHSIRFYVANADFATVGGGAIISAYTETAVPTTAGTLGNVYTVDAGSYDWIAAVVTNNGAVPATVTVAVGYDLVAEAATALYTVAEAKAHDKAQLASGFTDAVIIAQEARTRSKFTVACEVDFIPTVHSDELQDGYGTSSVGLDWPLPITISAVSIRTGTTWTALTAAELATLQPGENGELYWDCGHFPVGVRNVKVTYTAGHASVPPLIKKAALDEAVDELPVSNTPFQAESYEAGGTSYSWQAGDGFAGAWSRLPSVMLALRLYDKSGVGIG
jgi:hypothetical protein